MQINKTDNTNFNGRAFIYDGGNMLKLRQKMKLKSLARLLPNDDVVIIGTREFKTHDVCSEEVFKMREVRVNTRNNNYGMTKEHFEQDLKKINPDYDHLPPKQQKKVFKQVVYDYLKTLLTVDIPTERRVQRSPYKFVENEKISELKREMKKFSKKKKTYSRFDFEWKPIKDFFQGSRLG